MSVPPALTDKAQNDTSIDINGWTISAHKSTISNTNELESLHAALEIPLPEMTFGNNNLLLKHHATGWQYIFDARGALESVRSGELQPGDGGVKVGYADAWLKSRTDPDSKIPLPKTVYAKPYDWTYTSTYCGKTLAPSVEFRPADPEDPAHSIPLEELTRRDPILFFADVPLFEDELHDNGASQASVRVRVMPRCIFVLLRFTLRVDNVLFRTFDTRLYHSFQSNPPLIVLETKGWEAPYDTVKECLTDKEDLTPLTDPNFIAQALASLPPGIAQRAGAGTKWRGLGTKTRVLQLGESS